MKKFDGETLKNPFLFEESRPSLAILFMIAAMFLISLVDSFCKAFTDELHAVQLVWGYFVGIFAALCLYFVFRRLGFRALAHTNRMGLHWFRSGCLVGSIMSLFVGLTYMPIADATAIGFMAPLFITILSIPLLNEKVGTHRWIAVVAGLIGVVIIIRPGGGIWHWSSIMPLIGAVFFAFYQITTRVITSNDRTQTILFHTGFGGVVWSSIIVLFFWNETRTEHWILFFGTGILGALAHLCMVSAFRRAQASLIAPFNYTKLIFVGILGFIMFEEVPTLNTLIGSALIVFAGLFVYYQESRTANTNNQTGE